jgi:hypothetical protein
LEVWVLETISWISFLNSSPWLGQDRFIIRGKSVYFLINTLISNISLFLFELYQIFVVNISWKWIDLLWFNSIR